MDEDLHQMENIQIKDLAFQIHISEPKIRQRIASLAAQMNVELATASPIFIAVLNGSFIFAADLLRQLDFPCEIQFVKVPLEVHFTGFEVGNEFLVGYGLNYDGFGRNLPHIYQAVEPTRV